MSTIPDYTAAAAASAPASGRFELRPLSTGEVLDRTFQLYRGRFWLFAAISSFVPAVNTLLTLAQSITIHHLGNHTAVYRQFTAVAFVYSILICSVLLYGVTQAATTWAVSAIYLGREASMASAYRAIRPHWVRYTLIPVAQYFIAGWPLMLLFVMSKRCSCSALLSVEGMVPVSWLLKSVNPVNVELAGTASGMVPLRLLLPASQTSR